MKKFGHLPEQRVPLGPLVDKIVGDLFLVFAGNGYKQVGFQLIVQNLENDEVAGGGNLRPDGVETILTNALARVREILAANDLKPCDGNHGAPACADPRCWQRDEGKPSAPNDGITKH